MTTIPKIIHTCWFGKCEKPDLIKRLMITQSKVLDTYTHIEWNESNFPISKYSFIENAYQQRKWAHVSDMVRLIALYEHGGVYLDTDVEVIRPFDNLLDNDLFLGYMWDCNLGTAVIGSKPRNNIIKGILELYVDNKTINLNSPNNDLFTHFFLKNIRSFRLNGQFHKGDGVTILPKDYFEQPSLLKLRNYTVHHFSQSWKSNSVLKRFIKNTTIRIFGLYIYRKIICRKALIRSPFHHIYKEHTKKP